MGITLAAGMLAKGIPFKRRAAKVESSETEMFSRSRAHLNHKVDGYTTNRISSLALIRNR